MQLFPVYQSIIDVQSSQPVGFEAMIRARVGRAQICAGDLFAEARRTHSVVSLDNQARQVTVSTYDRPEPLWVNCEVTTLDAGALEFPPNVDLSRIVLEVTEAVQFKTPIEDIAKYLDPFRQRGMKVAIDDYGAAWSNLTRIQMLEPEYLKLDRRISVNVAANPSVVAGMVSFCERAGIQLVAEGIQTQEQADVIRSMGVKFAQGYYYNMPHQLHEEVLGR